MMVFSMGSLRLYLWCVIWYHPSLVFDTLRAKGSRSTPPGSFAAMSQEELHHELTQANQRMDEQRRLTQVDVYAAQQRLWFETRHKRGPPSTTMSAAATPQDEHMEVDGSASASTAQPEVQGPALFQPVPIASEAAYTMTAAQAGVDINDTGAVQTYMQAPVTTRRQVLDTIRDYHVAVIRPEVFHLVAQIEGVISQLDDRMLRMQDNMNWLSSENRAAQKRESGLMVVLTGFDPKMSPQERLHQINWMLGQVEEVKQFLFQRQYNASDECQLYYLSALQMDPSTPPAGETKWSTVTTILFKSWDLRRAYMNTFGGGKGTPLWKDGKAVQGFHIRSTPSSPQFQRKLELPIRVVLYLLNKHAEMQATTPEPLSILWRTLTIMSPSSTGDFDDQARAMARMHYLEQDGEFKGRLEITKELAVKFRATPPEGAEEPNLWDYAWNQVAFGIQAELDRAEKELMEGAKSKTQGSSKGLQLGKGRVHWSSPFIYSCSFNPYPIAMTIDIVESVCYSWDEFCDKAGKPQLKCGDYSKGTYCGAPAAATTQPAVSKSSGPDTGKGAAKAGAPAFGKAKGRGRG